MSRLASPDTIKTHPTFKIEEINMKQVRRELKLKKGEPLRVLVMPDTHFPDQDRKAVNCMLAFAKKYKPHIFIHLGDFYEMGYVSPHSKESNSIDMARQEIKKGAKFMKKMVKKIGAKFNYFTCGNHEYWMQALWDKHFPNVTPPPELDYLKVCTFDDTFKSVPFNHYLKLGNMHFTHGYSTGKHHASKNLAIVGGCITYGHCETTQQHTDISITGVRAAYCLGTMRDPDKARFLKNAPTKWVHAFGAMDVLEDGNFTIVVPHIINGKTSLMGEVFKG